MPWNEFMLKRKLQAEKLLEPDSSNPDPWYPFDSPEYTYAADIADAVDSETRRLWLASEHGRLIPEDPFEIDSRTGLPAVWSAVLGIPASKMRGSSFVTNKNVPTVRTINDAWQNDTYVNLNRIGRTSPEGEYRRPSGSWILDVVSDPKGWWLLELAHMLAHKVEDAAELAKKPVPYTYGQNATAFQTMLFKLFLCKKFGIPTDVEPGIDDGTDPFAKYGIYPVVSTNLRNPLMRVPADGKWCLKPGTVCVVNGSIHIEPTPYAMASGSDKWLAMNRWSCNPTIVSFVGWELVDVVTHAPLLSNGWSSPEYVLTPMSLQEAPSFDEFLECAYAHFGKTEPDGKRLWLVDDYLDSDKFMVDLAASPPLPCKRCLKLNMESEGSPSRPKSEKPDKIVTENTVMTQAQREWLDWDNNMNKVFRIVEKATKYMEIRELGAGKAVRFRKTRKHAYSKKVNSLRRMSYLSRKAEKLRKNGYMTKAEELENKIKEIKDELERS